MEKNENPRLKMLGLLTKEENNLVLYDALLAKGYSKFSYLVEKGYAITAFILNCMIDFGFEDKIREVLKSAQRHDDNIYEFMVAYWGQEQAEDFFAGHDFRTLIEQKFSDKSLVKYKLWKIVLIKQNYKLLLENGQLQLIKDNLKGCDINKLVDALIEAKKFDFVVELEWEWKLRDDLAGMRYLRKTKNWNALLHLNENNLVITFNCKSIEEVYDQMISEGATDAFFDFSAETKNHLLKRGVFRPFIDAKDWHSLYHAKCYKEINLDDWWTENTSDVVIKAVIKTAINAKNWDFLEQRKCLRALFKNFRWQRCYRIWCS